MLILEHETRINCLIYDNKQNYVLAIKVVIKHQQSYTDIQEIIIGAIHKLVLKFQYLKTSDSLMK